MTSSRSKSAGQRVSSGSRNVVRIIAGRWRGRRIVFPDAAGLRPTPDRVRETVFNWLQPAIAGARCLDLFAGSGALGFESLSRGADHVVFVERERPVCEQLRASAKTLDASGAQIECADALQWLRNTPSTPFDVVFLDPPFASGVLPQVCELLATREWLAPGAAIYLEASEAVPLSFLPAAWRVVRSKRAGQVGYHLARLPAAGASTL